MPYEVLARKYRPKTFKEVIGQQHVTDTLLKTVVEGRIANGYIFSGHRGIGKTTISRILSAALNCVHPIGSEFRPTGEPCNQCNSCKDIRDGSSPDVTEIDSATNRGIDDIKAIRESTNFEPTRDKYKIFIFDEAHQITDAGFNALLKTLEEPPSYVIFMFATTEPDDIPQTIRSRCQHFSFRAVRYKELYDQIKLISDKELINIDDVSISLLAELGDGSVRDALSIMDQSISSNSIDIKNLYNISGAIPKIVYEKLLDSIYNKSTKNSITIVNRVLESNYSTGSFIKSLVKYLRNCIIAKISNDNVEIFNELVQLSEEEKERIKRSSKLYSEEDLTRYLSLSLKISDELKNKENQRFHLELLVVKLCLLQKMLSVENIVSNLKNN